MAPKPKPKPLPSPSQPPPPIEDLFASLNGHIHNSNFKLAVKVADQVLVVAPGDEDAIRCKVVALLKDDLIDDALRAIQGARNALVDFRFYEAYCMYRLNKLDKALDCLKNQEQDASSMLLESQILYRLGKMDLSANIYKKLQKAKIDSLEINVVASLIAAGRASDVQGTLDDLRVRATSSFELAYNTACSLIEREKLADAEQLLLSARRIGQETLLEENLDTDDVEKELAPIAVQLAYVQQSFGHSKEAMESYSGIISHNLADEASIAMAINNLISLKGPKDASDSLRKLDRLKETDSQNLQCALEMKLLQKQKEAIYKNRVLLLIHANKLDQAREVLASLLENLPESIIPVLLQAAVFVREKKAGKAEEILWQFVEKHPDKAKTILLARAQIAATAGHHLVAAESVDKIPDIQHMPATVATLVALRERAGDIDGAAVVLDSAIKWWSNAMTEDNHLSVIMQEAAAFRVRHGKQEDAARLYEELVKSHGSIEALVGVITTTALVDIAKAEAYEKQLKPLPGLKVISVDNLEKTSGAKQDEVGAFNGMAEAMEESKSKEKPKKKRKRKPKYPKGFNPANPGPLPDPERWLPKRERSSYRPKRKDKRAAQVRGSQGAVVREKHEASAVGANNGPSAKSGQASISKGVAQEQSKPSSKSSRKKSRN